ncbi:hypothetical protein GCM10020258_48470 [Sphingomonas yabuuchiae]
MRIAIVTDAWSPQVNGVVRTLQSVTGELRAMGHEVRVVSPTSSPRSPAPLTPKSVWRYPPPVRSGGR